MEEISYLYSVILLTLSFIVAFSPQNTEGKGLDTKKWISFTL